MENELTPTEIFKVFTKAHDQLHDMSCSFSLLIKQCRELVFAPAKLEELLVALARVKLAHNKHIESDVSRLPPDEQIGACSNGCCRCTGYVNKSDACLIKKAEWQEILNREHEIVDSLRVFGALLLANKLDGGSDD